MIRFENRKEKRNLNKYELQFEMRTSLSFLSSRTICVKSARLIHFKSLHQNTGSDHIGTVCHGIHDIAVRPPQIM